MIHDIIILITVIVIIGIQLKIFFETKKNINSYESIMKNPQDFQTYKVYISEKELENIDSQHILDNLNIYTKKPELLKIEDIEVLNHEVDNFNFQETLFDNNDLD